MWPEPKPTQDMKLAKQWIHMLAEAEPCYGLRAMLKTIADGYGRVDKETRDNAFREAEELSNKHADRLVFKR